MASRWFKGSQVKGDMNLEAHWMTFGKSIKLRLPNRVVAKIKRGRKDTHVY